MSFSDITRWLSSDWTHAVAGVVIALLAYSMIWAVVRASIERVTGRPLARTRLVLVLDVVADVANNLPGALNRILRSTGRDPLFLPSPAPTEAERYEAERRALMADPDRAPLPRGPSRAPSAPSGQSGRATAATLMLLALVGALGLAACPRWDRPRCETPGVYACADDQPHYCAPSRELTPIGDEPCARQGRVCALASDGVASCAAVSR